MVPWARGAVAPLLSAICNCAVEYLEKLPRETCESKVGECSLGKLVASVGEVWNCVKEKVQIGRESRSKARSRVSDTPIRPTRAVREEVPCLFCGENNFGMEEGSGDAGGDGEEFGLAGEDFNLAGAGEVGKVDGAPAADAGGGGFVGGDGGELRQEQAGMDEERRDSARVCCHVARESRFLHCASPSLREGAAPVGMTNFYLDSFCFGSFCFGKEGFRGFDFFDGVGLGDVEFGNGGAAEGFEMGSAAEALAHFVSDGTHVGSGGDAGAEVGAAGIDGGNVEFFDIDFHGLKDDFFLFAR